jgi:hypothetical protein
MNYGVSDVTYARIIYIYIYIYKFFLTVINNSFYEPHVD